MTAPWSPVLVLEGSYNVRDLGGYATVHGDVIRRGLVYRSASLSALTDNDLARLGSLGVRLAIDLRSSSERTRRPSKMTTEVWARDYDASDADLIRMLLAPDCTPPLAVELMRRTYRKLPEEQAASIAELFRRIGENDLPLIFHCAAGKDRTGVAAALLMELLEAPRASIIEDYVRTREDSHRNRADAKAALAAAGLDLPDKLLQSVADADPIYLEAMFEALEASYGGVLDYVRERLGLDDTDITRIRERLLEPAA